MLSSFVAVAALLGGASAAPAQLLTLKEAPVAVGHYHLHVTSIDAHKKFWVDTLGGQWVPLGSIEVVQYPNIFILLQQTPPQGSKGTPIDHIAFHVANLKSVVEKLKAAGYTMTTGTDVNRMYPVNGDIATMASHHQTTAFVSGPDDVKVELIEGGNLAHPETSASSPIVFDHIHFTAQDYTAYRQWYMKTFGAVMGRQDFEAKRLDLTGLPGALRFSRPDRAAFSLMASPVPHSTPAGQPALEPTKNHVVDHIGLEVKGLEAFCQRLERSGVKLDRAYSRNEKTGIGVAFIADPWGTAIELNEGLNTVH